MALQFSRGMVLTTLALETSLSVSLKGTPGITAEQLLQAVNNLLIRVLDKKMRAAS